MREKLITRTVISLEVVVLGINTENMTENRRLVIPEMKEKAIVPYLTANIDDGFIPVKVLSCNKVEELRAMTEADFIIHSFALPPRKNYNTEKAEG